MKKVHLNDIVKDTNLVKPRKLDENDDILIDEIVKEQDRIIKSKTVDFSKLEGKTFKY